ncbi:MULTISPECIES: A24 family peptidase [Halobacterium]|uniref:Prepilin/prearchaellin peptidase n=5 Tax=Halobacterium salinarum TaxID=2242 RepID=A0A510NA43_HALSA|nr:MULTISPECIES: A24 family peptidase [Halobacterium]MBB6089675.1 preflagellin peptidase FlaK [Halobacterium salinarum]MDL0119855.1 A24 family peptidase [Halobacterium salinarum]MDL0122801.1 A24 family peptidase [Halobacterium salinarum]MDL0125819.1 A24 family peptidase [Halobacterium salinarum]MDL0128239.1 A24 family peptidase [Halobacterium salinarum]
MVDASIPDLLRLVAVPALGWAAVRDIHTRRVSNTLWGPLALLGVLLLLWDGFVALGIPGGLTPFAIRTAFSLLFVIPLAYGFWYIGGFGGADARAFMVLAVLFPTYPAYEFAGYALPGVSTTLGVFSLTVLTNTVLFALAYPLVLGARNALTGNVSVVMFVGRRVAADDLATVHGSLLESSAGGFTRSGLDLDALRMYLRWRDCTLADLRSDPGLRHPDTLPDTPGDPTDGAVATDGSGDPWGAAAFLADIDHSAYGTTPAQLRDGLDLITDHDDVWVTPGVPFLLPLFAGLVVALTFGDVLFYVLDALGFAAA